MDVRNIISYQKFIVQKFIIYLDIQQILGTMQIINSLVNWLNVKRMYQIELFKNYPLDVQQEQLFKLISKAEDTEWGKKYDYQSVESIEDFQKRVPVSRYENMKPYIDRLLKGEKDVVWPGTIKWLPNHPELPAIKASSSP